MSCAQHNAEANQKSEWSNLVLYIKEKAEVTPKIWKAIATFILTKKIGIANSVDLCINMH